MARTGYLTQQEKADTIPLWREAFPEDGPEFLDYYYKEKTRDNRILAVREENGRVVSMVQRNPYRLLVKGRKVNSDYLVAVATAKDRRHQGLMRKLLTGIFKDMHCEGMPFCYLMPADRRIYEPFDFAYIYDQEHWRVTEEAEQILEKQKVREEDSEKAARWMEGWLEERYQVFAVRDRAYVSRLLKELESENGWMEFLIDKGRTVGIRCLWGAGEKEQRMLLCHEAYRQTEKEKTPAIMARITDLKRCLEMICLREDSLSDCLEMVLEVEDDLCPWNCGTFLWKIGREQSSVERICPGLPHLRIGIGPLAQWVFGYRRLEELECTVNLYGPGSKGPAVQESQVGTWEGVFLDEVV